VPVWCNGNGIGHVNKVTLHQAQLILGRMTRFKPANHLSISPSHPGQLNLPTSVGWEIITSQSVAKLCHWGL